MERKLIIYEDSQEILREKEDSETVKTLIKQKILDSNGNELVCSVFLGLR